MKELTPRQKGEVWSHAKVLFDPESRLVPRQLSDWDEFEGFSRELLIGGSRELVLSDAGVAALRDTIAALEALDLSDGLAGRADIEGACRSVLQGQIAQGVYPRNANEGLKLISGELERGISNYTYIVPIMGVAFDGINQLSLGSLNIIALSMTFLVQAGANGVAEVADIAMGRMGKNLWIVGTERGTKDVSYKRFVGRCRLVCGFLAVFAATRSKVGSHGLRIGVLTAPEEGYEDAVSLFWNDGDRELTQHTNCRRARNFTIDAPMRNNIILSVAGQNVLRILDTQHPTVLEDLWVKALFWYSDAHRDQTAVMRLLKFWSCVETFFSGSRVEITKSVTFGLAAALVYGDSPLIPKTEYKSLKETLTRMYGQRSAATHGAAYSHVTDIDAANLSHWVAWMLWNVMDFMLAGKATPEDIISELRSRAPGDTP